MFERYTENARRVIFFARYEASEFGSPYIETEHLLLGLLREDKALTNRFLRSAAAVQSIRKQIENITTIREKISTSVDLPLSNESKRVLAYAAEEAERLSHQHIGTEHLLLGLLREEGSFAAAILRERGLDVEAIRTELAQHAHVPAPVTSAGTAANAAVLAHVPIDFVKGGERISEAPVYGHIVPRIGEEVIVESEEDQHSFRVVDVAYMYEHFVTDGPHAPQRLAKIIVRVKESATSDSDAAPNPRH